MYPYSHLGSDSFGPPRPGQTYEQFQTQMHPAVAISGIAAITVVNPIVGIAVGLGYLLTQKNPVLAKNKPTYEERKGGH